MFPKPKNTPRGRELRAKFETEENLHEWPQPTMQDHALIGVVVVQFGYVDFNFRRLAELFDRANLLDSKWVGKTAKLTMADAAVAVQSSSVWTGPLAYMLSVLQEIEELRAIRNLLSHCAIRRFPDDDALLFIFNMRCMARNRLFSPHWGQRWIATRSGRPLNASTSCKGRLLKSRQI